MFTCYELRTVDLEAAQSFYAEVMGWQVQPSPAGAIFYSGYSGRAGGRPVGGLSVMPEQARARGAPPNWLGHVAVAAVADSVRDFVAAGGEQLGPLRSFGRGEVAVVRDPLGA